MSGLDAEVEENNPFSEEHHTEQHIASFISQSNLDQESQQALHKVFANYSPVKVQQFDDEADKIEEMEEGASTTKVSVNEGKDQPEQSQNPPAGR